METNEFISNEDTQHDLGNKVLKYYINLWNIIKWNLVSDLCFPKPSNLYSLLFKLEKN